LTTSKRSSRISISDNEIMTISDSSWNLALWKW
jgi:hypothetical protein